MPALPRNTYQTPHGYQFRFVIPAELRPALGKREIKKALGRDIRAAVSEARLLALQADRLIAETREKLAAVRERQSDIDAFLAKPHDRRLTPVTAVTPELVSGLSSLWLATLEADITWRRGGLEESEYEELQTNIRQFKARIARSLARGEPEPFLGVVRNLLAGRGYELAVSPEAERELVMDLLPTLQVGYDILEQRQAGRMVRPTVPEVPPLPAAWEIPTRRAPGFSWDDLIDHWRQDRERPKRTVMEARAFIDALAAFLPQATPAGVTKVQVTEWLRHERETRGNSAATLCKKGTLVGALFSAAVKDGLLDRNPFAGYDYSRLAAKEGIANAEERQPFTMDQLELVFSATEGVFASKKVVGGGGYHARVWIPLIALFSGARLDEIGSLLVSDFVLEPAPHFAIRRGKTQSSVRNVPLHPELIKLGLLDYVSAVQAAGEERLWPKLGTRARINSDSEILGRWFNRFIHDKLDMPSTVVFHSFRHTFIDLARDALIPREISQAITGHAEAEGQRRRRKLNEGDKYGRGHNVTVLLKQIAKIRLPFAIPKPAPYGRTGG